MADLLGCSSEVAFSSDNAYRYWLKRTWDNDCPLLGWIMLNPSTATAEKNDPTIERVQRRTSRMGYGGFVVVNLFALRATDPGVMLSHESPVSHPGAPEGNDENIQRAFRECGAIIAAWGCHGTYRGRAADVVKMAKDAGISLACLGTTKGGHPRHPLYVKYSALVAAY